MGLLIKFSLALFLSLTTLASINTCFAQNTQQDYLDAHNAARAQVGVGPMQWDDQVANYARMYANKIQSANTCNNLVHSGGPYGENLAAAFPDLTGRQAVNLWVSEKANYNYNSNSCAAGKVCGHYTQVVWRNSLKLGCARVRCNNGWWYVICSYDPPGNVVGQSPFTGQNERQEYLDAHNAARAEVGVGPMQWDDQVANYARNHANGVQSANSCANLVHSGGPYGENLAAAIPVLSAGQAVDLWVAEKADYDSCSPGKICGHYKQVVWRKSVRLGCARVRCDNGWWYVICSYDPPGNVQGQSPY